MMRIHAKGLRIIPAIQIQPRSGVQGMMPHDKNGRSPARIRNCILALAGLIAMVAACQIIQISKLWLRTNRLLQLQAELTARGFNSRVSTSYGLPWRLDEKLPASVQMRTRVISGVDFEDLTDATSELDFLANYPDIQHVWFRRSTVNPSVVRSLRCLPNLKHLSFTAYATIDPAALFNECEDLPHLKQLTLYCAPPFPDEALDDFCSKRPDVALYFGGSRPSVKPSKPNP